VFGIAPDPTNSPPGFEGYNIKLTVTPPNGVPEPATVMLLAAGVTAVGLDAARRRKRR
jgi:PEP-CTERM motif